jgi:hypothetical protein
MVGGGGEERQGWLFDPRVSRRRRRRKRHTRERRGVVFFSLSLLVCVRARVGEGERVRGGAFLLVLVAVVCDREAV